MFKLKKYLKLLERFLYNNIILYYDSVWFIKIYLYIFFYIFCIVIFLGRRRRKIILNF